jgi:hypothetical protein
MAIEANVYTIFGVNDLIAHCLYVSPSKDVILLQFYSNGNLK